ncbi:MAG: formyltetrahydrofolate deformylase [Candidatus Omnitrophica bacterium]|nr:formyltetrahydrofolate deformylase [Candidatus Omnitrophota bacterium]
MSNAILLISAPDKKGITAAVTNFIFENNGNIEHADQHIDFDSNTFFMRIEWSLKEFSIPKENLKETFTPLAKKFSMDWSLNFNDQSENLAIFVSQKTHCLYDLLQKYQQGYLRCEIPLIISNHKKAEPIAKYFKIPFQYMPKNDHQKKEIEKKEIALLKEKKIDLVILARYMQVFSEKFVSVFKNRAINIHHSFLPAFAGKNPYQQAHRHGVKIIGATSHYITKKLDRGPIIEQDTVRVSHRDSVTDLRREGQDLERIVLSRAVRLHLDKKILVYGNKTVVFD